MNAYILRTICWDKFFVCLTNVLFLRPPVGRAKVGIHNLRWQDLRIFDPLSYLLTSFLHMYYVVLYTMQYR